MFKYIFVAIVGAAVYLLFFFDMQLTNEMIGRIFVGAIAAAFVIFLIFKVGLHYRINTLNGFATAFYYAVFEYKKIQTEPSDFPFEESVREQAEVALAANFDQQDADLCGGKDIAVRIVHPDSMHRSRCRRAR